MCHGFDLSDRREFEREESEDDDPSFANEEASVETEVLTDGGDEEQEAPDE